MRSPLRSLWLDDLQLWFAERRPRLDRRRSSSAGHGPRLDALRDRGDDLRARWAGLPDQGRVMVASSGLASMAVATVATLVVLSGSSWLSPATTTTTDVLIQPSPTSTLPPVEADGALLPPATEPPAEPPAEPPPPGEPPLPADPAIPGPSAPAGGGAGPGPADRPSFGGTPGGGGGPGPVGPRPPRGTEPPAAQPPETKPPATTAPPTNAPPTNAPTTLAPPKSTSSTRLVCNGNYINGVCVPRTGTTAPSSDIP